MDNQKVLMNWLGMLAKLLTEQGVKLDELSSNGEGSEEKWRVNRRLWIKQCRTGTQEDLLARGYGTLDSPKPKTWMCGMWNAGRITMANGNPQTYTYIRTTTV